MTSTASPPTSSVDQFVAALFDADFYYTTYPDVRDAGVDAFDHYMSTGWRERRNASPTFNTGYYLDTHPDVAAVGINPLTHYVMAGVFEGRAAAPSSRQSSGKSIVLGAVSVREQAVHWGAVPDIGRPLDMRTLAMLLNDAFAASSRGAVLSLSHDQYLVSVGGVQNVVAAEAQALIERGWTYIHLCPARPLPMLAERQLPADSRLVLTLNGRREGVVRESDLLHVLQSHNASSPRTHFVVHHAMGFSPSTILALAQACNRSSVHVWVHDFFSLCANTFLLRNNKSFCGAPGAGSNACMVCNNGELRPSHVAAMHEVFDALRPTVLAPSATALDFWRSHSELSYVATHILPPARVVFEGEPVARAAGPLRVAHLGTPAAHKGWMTYAALVARHEEDPRYEFFRLGAGEAHLPGLKEVLVQVTPDNPDAMVNALCEQRIDVVINWSTCYETFSFITLEALAAGAFVVARRDAGNTWPAIAGVDADRGLPLQSDVELRALFLGDRLTELAAQPRTQGRLHRTHGTADLLIEEDRCE